MSSITNTNNPIQGNVAYNNTSGSIAQVIVNWNYFYFPSDLLSVSCYFTYNVNAQGASAGGEESSNRRVNVWLNDVQVAVDQDTFFSLQTYASATPITKIRVTLSVDGSVWIAAGPARTGTATASIDYTVNIRNINNTTDFAIVSSNGINADGKLFLLLPPASNNTIKPLFIKNAGTGKQIWVLTRGENITDLSENGVYFANDWACLTLISSGTSWSIANYYPSNNQSTLVGTGTAVTDPGKISTASLNVLNIFDSDTGNRPSGDNLVNLPTTSSPAICCVSYIGAAQKQGGNALQFSLLSGTFIDNYDIASNRPYIITDSSTKSPGIIFINDGTQWYIVGYYYGVNWSWDSNIEGGYYTLPSSPTQSILITAPSINKFYYTPTTINVNPYFFIIKIGTTSSTGVRFSSYIQGQTKRDYFNKTSSDRVFYAGNQTNMCLWLFSNASTFISWYPLIGYTPN